MLSGADPRRTNLSAPGRDRDGVDPGRLRLRGLVAVVPRLH